MAIVYALKNLTNGKCYVGCTKGNLAKRLREHRCMLRAGKHAEPDLQADWTRLGEAKFKMILLEELPPGASTAAKREAELSWMKDFGERRGVPEGTFLYNRYRHSFALSPEAIAKGVKAAWAMPDAAAKRHTPELRERRRQAQLGKPKGHGAKISATKQRRKVEREAGHDIV